MATPFNPNDVAVVLRPVIKDGTCNGDFELMVSVVGPITLPQEEIRTLVSIASLLASAVPLMEESKPFTELLMKKCEEIYEDGGYVLMNEVVVDQTKTEALTEDTKTVGGIQ
jgi:hypothetical protein